ncbi:unannotated protein [freshwater metagenome]|uniref:Unannotated protein n=1 Tax=freshwater metagenome TaxID=449393 RepID=A0A6J7ELN7_9ZZZZ|nr:hypothetical protein [Actinomycetota bacterium]
MQTNDHFIKDLDRRTFLMTALVAPALAAALAACGSTNKAASNAIRHATGREDLVLRIGYEGGFTAPSYQFVRVPTALISGDGRVIAAGVQTEQFPGPLLPALTERTITEAGIQRVLELADAAKLLQPPPDYTAEMNVADAPDTVVTLTVNGQTYEHRAYALGMTEPESTPARKALAGFVTAMSDFATVAGAANLGGEGPLVAENYRIQARVVTDADLAGYDQSIPPVKVAWPSGAGVGLASASTCAVVAAPNVDAVLQAATQMTFFTDNGVIYQVAAVAKLPGDTCVAG